MSWPRDTQALVRGFSAGLISALMGILGHSAGGGGMLSESSLLLLALSCSGVGYFTARHPSTSFTWLAALLTTGQATAHLALTADAGQHHSLAPGRTMLLAHLAATVIAALLISGADAALRILCTQISACLQVLLRPGAADDRTTWAVVDQVLPARCRLQASAGISRRGPPASS